MSSRATKRFKSEAAVFIPLKKKWRRRLWSKGLGWRKGFPSVARTRGPMFASPEIKYYDAVRNYIIIPAVGTQNLTADTSTAPPQGTLCCPILGNDINNRVGRKINVRTIRINGQIYFPAQVGESSIDGPLVVRVIVLQDKQSNATLCTLLDSHQTNLISNSAITAINVPQNLATLGRFRVLKDKRYTMADDLSMVGNYSTATLGQAGQVINFKYNLKFKKHPTVHFNTKTDNVFDNIYSNNFVLYACATYSSTVPPAAAYITYFSRASFYDV